MVDPPKTVLVVEDSPTQALQLQLLLEEEGLQVVCAVDGETGLALATQVRPDLIILDIQLPGIDGFQVCRCLKELPGVADIPVIMFTRHDTPEAIMLGLESGAVDYIPKDVFAHAVLLETLRQMGLITSSASLGDIGDIEVEL
jgi:DNA-binding response OmpR family regulator